jgi:hypothetical protein
MTSLTDYSNTVIYKISCRDPTVSGVYVGHTVDFIKRKYAHQKSSEDNKCTNLLYRTIRMHGGWDNWEMKMVGFFHCNNLTEAREKEQEFFISLNASLNSVEPMPNRVVREKVNKPVVAVNENVEETDMKETAVVKHAVEKVELEPVILADGRFSCKICEYVCQTKQHYKQHCFTKKHTKNVEYSMHKCQRCGKLYKERTGLWRHSKVCVYEPQPTNIQHNFIDEVKQLITESRELRNYVVGHTVEFKEMLKEHRNDMKEIITNAFSDIKQK